MRGQDVRLTTACRMVADGAVPNTKTFTALIGSFGKMGSVGAALDIITELLGHDQGMAASASTYAALMAACEKAGQGDLALALFEKMKAQVCPMCQLLQPRYLLPPAQAYKLHSIYIVIREHLVYAEHAA